MKKIVRSKLNLSRQTLRTLQVDELLRVGGGVDTQDGCVTNYDTCVAGISVWNLCNR